MVIPEDGQKEDGKTAMDIFNNMMKDNASKVKHILLKEKLLLRSTTSETKT